MPLFANQITGEVIFHTPTVPSAKPVPGIRETLSAFSEMRALIEREGLIDDCEQMLDVIRRRLCLND